MLSSGVTLRRGRGARRGSFQRAFELGHPFAVLGQFAVHLIESLVHFRMQVVQPLVRVGEALADVGLQVVQVLSDVGLQVVHALPDVVLQVVDTFVDVLAQVADLGPQPSEQPRISTGVSHGSNCSIEIAFRLGC